MCQSLDELIKSWSLHLNQSAIWTSICKYYAAEFNLNMNPASSARLCMNGADTRFVYWHYIHTQGHKYMKNISRIVLRVTSRAFYHLSWVKLASVRVYDMMLVLLNW